MENTLYPNNIYIKNYESFANDGLDRGVSLDNFDAKYGLEHNDRLRAEYYHWLSEYTGNEEILKPEYKKILGLI